MGTMGNDTLVVQWRSSEVQRWRMISRNINYLSDQDDSCSRMYMCGFSALLLIRLYFAEQCLFQFAYFSLALLKNIPFKQQMS